MTSTLSTSVLKLNNASINTYNGLVNLPENTTIDGFQISTKIRNSTNILFKTPTNNKQTILYNNEKTIAISDTDIVSTFNNVNENSQTITFGPSIPNIFVACGEGTNTLAYSTDGIAWTGLGNTIFDTMGKCSLWNGSMWVAGGEGSIHTLAYSYDGITWTGLGNTIFATYVNGLAWNGSMWIAVGVGWQNTIAYSYDGINWIGLGINVFSSGNAVAWNGELWVAVGQGTNVITTSTDGITWTTTATNTFSTRGTAIIWTGTNWIAGGLDQENFFTLKYSTDGLTWTNSESTIRFTANCYGFAWNGSRVVATGSGTYTILYSDDQGLTWTNASSGSFSTIGYGVAWNGTMWVAVGNDNSGNYIKYSYDGDIWYNVVENIFTTSGRNVGWNAMRRNKILMQKKYEFVATGDGNQNIAYSSDGINWNLVASNGELADEPLYCVASNNIIWIAGRELFHTNQNTMGYSYDGITWTGLGLIFNEMCLGVAWNGFMWVAVGRTSPTIAYSYDGINWTDTGSTFFINGRKVAWNGKYWLAVGNGTFSVARSYDGITWTGISTVFNNCNTIIWTGNWWVAGGNITGSNTFTIMYSNDGTVWTDASGTPLQVCRGLGQNGNQLVAVGTRLGTNKNIIYSNDYGLTWTDDDVVSDFSSVGYDVAWGGIWVAVGLNNNNVSIKYSYDRKTWVNITNTNIGQGYSVGVRTIFTEISIQHPTIAVGTSDNHTLGYSLDGIQWTGLGKTIFSTSGNSVAWNGIMWVAGGQGDSNTLAYSYDGLTWTGLGKTIFSTSVNGLAWNGEMWVAGGQGTTHTIAYSYDGINWSGLGKTIFSTAGNAVAWNGSMWVAVGSGSTTIATSTDGIIWSTTATNTFPSRGIAIIWTGTNWIAGGLHQDNFFTLKYSTDGLTWTNPESTVRFRANCYGLAWNGSRVVATGNGLYTILYSDDQGLTWTKASSGSFSTIGYSIAWNGTMWVAVGNDSSGNNIKYSHDGDIWYNVPSESLIFSGTGAYGRGVAGNPKVGVPIVASQCALNQTNKLDIVSGSYYNTGTKNISITTNAKILEF